MKIRDNSSSVQELQAHLARINSKTKPEEQAAVTKTNADAVNVSPTLKAEESEASSRKARVNELKSAVEEGRYNPDSKEVAKSVIRELFV